MQAGIDTLGETAFDPFHLHQFLDACALYPHHATESLEQRRTSTRTDAWHVLERAAIARLFAPLAMAADGKTMRLITHCGYQVQGW